MSSATRTSVSTPTADTGALPWFAKVREVLAGGSLVEFAPKGYSMWPTLRPECDEVLIEPADVYHPSDIVLAHCDSPHGIVLHRIVSINTDRVVLMGDSNLYQTETCALNAIAGRVVLIRRNGRDVTKSTSTRLLGTIQRLPAGLRRMAVRLINLKRNGIRRY